MEGYTVFARRYRPRVFAEVVGQEHVSRTLTNALKDGRLAHAYLFSGPRGVGKTTMARILAKALNCDRGPGPDSCLECDACVRIHAGADHDVVEIDAASNRNVEDARTLRESAKYTPLRSRHKVYIIDEAHMLTRDAFNTLLKLLEEPPAHVKFVFATTEPHKLPDTILSRCQRFEFGRITHKHLVERLKQICAQEKLAVDEAVLAKIAAVARGGMRDAESLLEQLVAFKEKDITAEDVARMVGAASDEAMTGLFEAVKSGATDEVLRRLDEIFVRGADPTALADQAIETVRALLIVQTCGRDQKILDLPDAARDALDALQRGLSHEALLYMMQLLFEARRRLREGLNPQAVLELAFAKLASASDLVKLGDAIQAIRSGAAAKPQPQAPPPPPPPPAPRPAADADLSTKWKAFLESIHEQASVLDRTVLGECAPSRLEGRDVILAVPPNLTSAMHRRIFDRLQKPRDGGHGQAFERFFGAGARMAFDLGREGGGGGTPSKPADPAIQEIFDKFQGMRVVDSD